MSFLTATQIAASHCATNCATDCATRFNRKCGNGCFLGSLRSDRKRLGIPLSPTNFLQLFNGHSGMLRLPAEALEHALKSRDAVLRVNFVMHFILVDKASEPPLSARSYLLFRTFF